MGEWTPQSHHRRVDTTESPQEGGNHRRVETMESPWEGGNHKVTMGQWKPETPWEGGNHGVTTLTNIQQVTKQQLTSSSQICK